MAKSNVLSDLQSILILFKTLPTSRFCHNNIWSISIFGTSLYTPSKEVTPKSLLLLYVEQCTLLKSIKLWYGQ